MHKFLFKDDSREEELSIVLKKSSFYEIKNLTIEKIEPDFNLGHFVFYIRHDRKLIKTLITDINDFWKFLEKTAISLEPVVFHTMYKSEEYFLYVEPSLKNFRFAVMDTVKLAKKQKEDSHFKYSYIDCKVNIDILIEKKKFIKSFYFAMVNMFKKQENIAFFEPAFIDFGFWIKDSEILKQYIKKPNNHKLAQRKG